MRLLLTFLIFDALLFANGESIADYIEVLHNCTNEHGMTVEMYGFAASGNNTDGMFEKSKCVEACMFKLLKILKDDGTIDVEHAVEHLWPDQPEVQRDTVRANIEKCPLEKGDNECDTAHNLMTCALKFK